MKRLVIIATITLLPLLSACNTMEGVGKDVQNGGQKIQNSADQNK